VLGLYIIDYPGQQVFDLKILSALALSQRVSREKIWEELGNLRACGYISDLHVL